MFLYGLQLILLLFFLVVYESSYSCTDGGPEQKRLAHRRMQLSTDPEKLITKSLKTTTDTSEKDRAHDNKSVATAMKPLATKVPTVVFDWVVRDAQAREVTASSVVREILERAYTESEGNLKRREG